MKKLFIMFVAASLSLGVAKAQEPAPAATSKAEITFEKDVHDYGTVEFGGNGVCEFKFKNTGTEPLIISNARGSCGCTVPDWPRNPIAPGQSSTIKVSYDTKRPGPINKTVTITSNSASSPNKVIRISGNVEAEKTQTAFPVGTPQQGPVEKTK